MSGFVDCLECGAPAEEVDRWTWPSTDGPIEHVATRCCAGHNLSMPVA